MKAVSFLLLFLMYVVNNATGAELRIKNSIIWTEKSFQNPSQNGSDFGYIFKNAIYKTSEIGQLPIFSIEQQLNFSEINRISIVEKKLKSIQTSKAGSFNKADEYFKIEWTAGFERKAGILKVYITPARKRGTEVQLLEEFELIIDYNVLPIFSQPLAKTGYTTQSVLSTGSWFKFVVTTSGIQRLTKSALLKAGINIDNIDPRTIKIYSNGPGMLPTLNNVSRIDDLKENPIIIKGESDGIFNDEDEILFYAKAQRDVWEFDSLSQRFKHVNNVYTDQTAFFLTFGGASGKRVQTIASSTPNRNSNEYDNLFLYERDLVNLIKSGKRFMGEEFNRSLTQNFTANLGNINTSVPVFFTSSVAARSFSPSSFTAYINGSALITHNIPQVNSSYIDAFASDVDGLKSATFSATSGNLTVTYVYNQTVQGSLGWLDYFELQSRNFLSFTGAQLLFRDKSSYALNTVTQYDIATSQSNITVWDVTLPTEPKAVSYSIQNGVLSFSAPGDTLREFIVFNGNYQEPVFAEKVANQNIHGLGATDYFIITHESFLSEANRLAQHHRNKNNLRVSVVTVQQVYNEFSGGVQDLCAIRDMMRMFYKRAPSQADAPKSLLLFGRASFDYKNRVKNNTNFVPTFESNQSFDPIKTYCSDDFFGLLDDNEGKWDQPIDNIGWSGIKEFLDISVGRLPATDAMNAAIMVSKSINYESAPEWGDWMNRMTFVADDEDGGIHENQAENLAQYARNNYKNQNIQKIFIDAYPEQVTAGGVRNPQAQADIVRSVERGCLLFNYTGHGGEVGLAAERILNTDDIQNWSNAGRLPIFVTATCEFSRYDDPERFAAGEMALINQNGGAVALYTTVRLVNSGSNYALNQYILNRIGYDSAAAFQPRKSIGEIMRLAKNDYFFTDKNERNFSLLGDPAMFLAYPEMGVRTTAINGMDINGPTTDTLKAFSKITIKGVVTDLQGNVQTTYNGLVFPTVFDKPTQYQTMRNNPAGYGGNTNPMNFMMQNNVIYRGQASVKNGNFEFSFIVPKDISYAFGLGRISYYSTNNALDAAGYYNNIMVGGTADSIIADNRGPEIKLYLNDEKFANGGTTNENPLLIAKISDENGVNITNRGIGRDIQSVMNNDNMTATVLNDFFQAQLDSYTSGEVRYKIKDLPPGKHTLKLGAWDTYNNYGESVLEFVVADDQNFALQNVLNYPNPFTTNTTFHFDHNRPGLPINVMVQVFTISGNLIKTLRTETVTAGNHFDQLSWDGMDEFGDRIAKGVYIYKVSIKSQDGKSAEEYQKLVILN
jgi:hypothetical protein